MKKLQLILFCCVFLLVACNIEDPTSTPTQPPQTAVLSQATATTVELATTMPPLPPPPTVPPIPTSTQPPQTATPLPTNTPEPILLLSEADFGTDRNPLTGELVADPAVLQRRPLAVKLSNSPATYTRPQSGLNQADLVFEHTTEGNITRFTAIFYGNTPARVGPIRSARLIDVELPVMYDAALFYSGSSVGVGNRLYSSDFRNRVFQETVEDGFYRSGEDKPWEHTLYGRPEAFWQALDRRQINTPPNFNTLMAFSDKPPTGGQPATQLTIDHDWTQIEWQYDPANGRYWRWSDSEIHRDGNTDEQVNAANVIVISPIHALDPEICEEIRNGVCAHLSVQVQLWGSGTGIVLRDGQQYQVTWQRINRQDMLTFLDSEGNPFPLKIGNSWVQVIPNWLDNPVSILP